MSFLGRWKDLGCVRECKCLRGVLKGCKELRMDVIDGDEG